MTPDHHRVAGAPRCPTRLPRVCGERQHWAAGAEADPAANEGGRSCFLSLRIRCARSDAAFGALSSQTAIGPAPARLHSRISLTRTETIAPPAQTERVPQRGDNCPPTAPGDGNDAGDSGVAGTARKVKPPAAPERTR